MENGIKKYIEIIRPPSCFFGSLTVLVGFLFALGSGHVSDLFTRPENVFKLISAMLVFFLVVGSGNTINDVFDLEIDRINRPKRTLVRGTFTERQAIHFYIYQIFIILLLSIIGASFSPNPSFIPAMVTFFLIISFSYSLFIKNTGLFANLTVAAAGALGMHFGALFILDTREVFTFSSLWFLYITAFFFLFGREVGKDLEDIEGDSKFGVKSIALRWGIKTARSVIIISSFCILISLIVAMIWYEFEIFYILFGLISVILLGIANWAYLRKITDKRWRILASRLELIAQFFAISAHLSGFLL